MKPLIQIISHRDGAMWRKAVRDTWLQQAVGLIPHRFIVGREAAVDNVDIEWFPVDDGYEGIAIKVQAGLKWALRNGFTHVFTCYCDTYTHPQRLMRSGFEQHHYSGHVPNETNGGGYTPLVCDYKGRYAYASGGAGYWLSQKAMEIVAYAEPRTQWDDLNTGWVLGEAGISCWHDPRYGFRGEHLYSKDQITCHLSQGTGNFDPAWIHRAHERLGNK